MFVSSNDVFRQLARAARRRRLGRRVFVIWTYSGWKVL